MARLITWDDILDVYLKGVQRGSSFLFSKLNPSKKARTKSAFNESSAVSSNWWNIPEVKARWNQKISGDSKIGYEEYFVRTQLEGKSGLKMLSIGSGVCSHELLFAQSGKFEKVTCLDLMDNLLRTAEEEAKTLGVEEILDCVRGDIFTHDFKEGQYDVILFHQALHHFDQMETFLRQTIVPLLNAEGVLLLNEYVGPTRMQYPKGQLNAVNECLKLIPETFRQRFKSKMIKKRYRGSGTLRVKLADPSECVDSGSMIPTLHKLFSVIEEKPYGGNVLSSTLKDIAHNFMVPSMEQDDVLNTVFAFEDKYLETHPSDFMYGVYQHHS
jgi:2-polyprenyl-3-methyl-5-hydroxy-6-metoxy-1,4-benzoquinol methylase